MRKSDFILPPNQIYLCGHSLGPMPKRAQVELDLAMQTWGNQAVSAWNTDAWIDLPRQVANKLAPFIGAKADDVIVSDSTSVNLFKVLMSALKINHPRRVILTTEDNFPADAYIAQGIAAFHGSVTLKTVARDELCQHLNEQVAVLMLSHVNYRDASSVDIQTLTAKAQQQGILTVWDLSHSVGVFPLNIQASHADFAVACSYKYLSGGPGAPAFIYVHPRHQQQLTSPIYGWMGHDEPFAFSPQFKSKNAQQFIGGTPYVLSLKALKGALMTLEGLDINALRSQSLQHSMSLIKSLEELGLSVITPLTDGRGGHVAFVHEEAYALARALIEHGAIVDYRNPSLIRLCVHPLYLELNDIQRCVDLLAHILKHKIHQAPKYQHTLRVT